MKGWVGSRRHRHGQNFTEEVASLQAAQPFGTTTTTKKVTTNKDNNNNNN